MTDAFSSAWGDYGGLFKTFTMSRLLMLDKGLNPVIDDLASAHTVSADGLTYTFTIRDGVKWHDGVAFSADDVVWSIHMALKSVQITSLFTRSFKSIVGAQDYIDGKATSIAGITVAGKVLTIKLSIPNSTFLLTMAQWPPYPKHLLEGEPPETMHLAKFWEKPVGNGPYMLTKFVPSQYAVLEPFPDYWGTKPLIKKIKMSSMTENDLVVQTQGNILDYVMNMTLSIIKEIIKNPNYVAHEVNILYDRYMLYNLMGYGGAGNSLYADIKTRQALSHGMDRETVVAKMFPGQGAVLNCMIPTAMPEYNKAVKVYEFDVVKSKALYTEAGYDFTKPTKMCYYYTNQATVDLMNALAADLKKAGVTVDHFLIQGDVVEALYKKREYDLCYAGFAPSCYEEMYAIFAGDDPTYASLRPSGPNVMDPLIAELNANTDPAKRQDILNRLQVAEGTLLWNSYLFSLKNYIVVNEKRLVTAGVYGHEWTNYNREIAKWYLK